MKKALTSLVRFGGRGTSDAPTPPPSGLVSPERTSQCFRLFGDGNVAGDEAGKWLWSGLVAGVERGCAVALGGWGIDHALVLA